MKELSIMPSSVILYTINFLHLLNQVFCQATHVLRGVFLDISEAFDKVWHIDLLFKLKSYGIDGELLSLLENYLENCKQGVILNGQTSEWR